VPYKPTGNPPGRPRGSKSKPKAEQPVEINRREVIRQTVEAALPEAFKGDAYTLFVETYKDTRLRLDLRLAAAARAIPYERAPLKAKEADAKAVIDVTPINPFAHMQAEVLKRYGVKKQPQR